MATFATLSPEPFLASDTARWFPVGTGLALPLVGDHLGAEGAEAEAQWSEGGDEERGTQEHWKNAIFPRPSARF